MLEIDYGSSVFYYGDGVHQVRRHYTIEYLFDCDNIELQTKYEREMHCILESFNVAMTQECQWGKEFLESIGVLIQNTEVVPYTLYYDSDCDVDLVESEIIKKGLECLYKITLATYLPRVESYLAEKQAMQKAPAVEDIPEKTVTLTVAECGEFHSLGEFHENIASVEEAIAVWKSIPPERMNGIPSIGINIHTEGTERYEDVEMDILSGKVIDLEVLDYVPDITDEPKAIEVIAELIDKLPDIEVRGSLEKWQAAILASQIDQFSYDYDTYQYQDTVEDREAQVANITEDIRNGNTGYLNDFLNAVISEGVREGITDIFGEGVEIDDSEAVQTARRAKELLDKLAEYKPLAKVEELEEQNYNMIDNVLNNGAEKKEQEQIKGRISIKEKLAEKKAVIEQRDKAERTSPEKETEKKSQREM